MTVLTNGRALAIAVDDKLVLPSGRVVPLDDVSGWDESDVDPSACAEDCRRVAEHLDEEGTRHRAVTPPKAPPRRVLPVLPAPAPYRPNVDPLGFGELCERVLTALRAEAAVSPWAQTRIRQVEDMCKRAAAHGGPTPAMFDLVFGIEDKIAARPTDLKLFLDLCDRAEAALAAAEQAGDAEGGKIVETRDAVRSLRKNAIRITFATPAMFRMISKINGVSEWYATRREGNESNEKEEGE